MMPSNHLIFYPRFSSCPQSFPVSGSFPMSQLFTSDGQRIVASASVLPMNIQGWFPLGLTALFFSSPRDFQKSSLAPQFESIDSLVLSLLYGPTVTFTHDYWKTIALTVWTFVSRVISPLINILSRFVNAFLSRSKHLLISWLQSPPEVILEPRK